MIQEFTTEELANEIWKPVVGFEGFYSVSNLGRVMRMGNTPKCKVNRLLKPSDAGSTGYFSVSLSVDNKRKGTDVHILVMAAFVGPCPSGHNVNHKDTIKTNSRLANLEYTTFQANTQHALRMGVMAVGDRHPSRLHPENLPRGLDHWTHKRPQNVLCGENRVNSKLTEKDVRRIRERYAQGGITQREISTDYGVTTSAIAGVVTRKTWKHIHP